MQTFIKEINEIQPSQLYISRTKLDRVENYLDAVELAEVGPLPVKKIGDNVFFTDGHTRAFALFKKGRSKVKVCWEEETLNWLQYLICVDWCKEAGINSIKDLKGNIINKEDYQKLWIDRCQRLEEKLENSLDNYNLNKIIHSEEKAQKYKQNLNFWNYPP